MDLIGDLGELAIGSRLKRLSDYIMREGKEIYKTYNIDFEPRWFPTFYLLSKESPLGVMEIAERLNITHPAVSQILKEMENRGLVSSVKDKMDKRKRLLSLSGDGKELVVRMEPVWKDIADSIHMMVSKHHHNLLTAIEETEHAFEELNFLARVKEITMNRHLNSVIIEDYKPANAKYFESLNKEWLKKYFSVEPNDEKIFSDPEKYIISPGGAIFFAKLNEEIVGTCALLKHSNEVYELTKMAVTEKAKGRQAGKKLGIAVVEKVRQSGGKKVVLESNKILIPALNLYRKLGFKKAHKDFSESVYERSNIYMELKLD